MAISGKENPWIEHWLSEERFEPFLIATKGSRALALETYEWNAKLGAAFLHDLGHLEVGVRNAFNMALLAATTDKESHWTNPATISRLFPVAPTVDSTTQSKKDISEICRSNILKAGRNTSTQENFMPAPEKIIAQLMFGFWTYLTSSALEKTIWVPYLYKVFPRGSNRQKINLTMSELRVFRNRVAHYEPIKGDGELMRRKILYIAKLVMPPEACKHLKANSEVSALLAKKPSLAGQDK